MSVNCVAKAPASPIMKVPTKSEFSLMEEIDREAELVRPRWEERVKEGERERVCVCVYVHLYTGYMIYRVKFVW